MEFNYETFFENSMEMLCIAAPDGYLVRVNAAFERVLGWSREELLSRPFVEFVHPDDVQDTEAQTAQLADGQECIYFENRWRCHDGGYRVLRWTAVPDEASGQFFAVAHDITDDIDAVHALATQVDDLKKRLKLSSQRLEHLSVTDPLTGVRNRRAFEESLQALGRLASRSGGWLSLVIFDIDEFKQFNDRFGHSAGDQVLSGLGQLILEVARRSDVACRYEEEEFVVILPDTSASGASRFAQRLVDAVRDFNWQHSQISVSVGVASVQFVPGETERLKWNLGKIVSDARRALRSSQAAGKNQITHAADAERELVGKSPY